MPLMHLQVRRMVVQTAVVFIESNVDETIEQLQQRVLGYAQTCRLNDLWVNAEVIDYDSDNILLLNMLANPGAVASTLLPAE